MRALLAAILLSAIGCAPHRTVPAVGTRLDARACFHVSGVSVYRDPESRCPEFDAVAERIRLVEERFGSVSGASVYIVDAWVECAGQDLGGCAVGDNVTVSGGVTVLGAILHELSHVAITRRLGDGSLAEYDLDHHGDDSLRALHPRFYRED